MKGENTTRDQLINELEGLRQRIAEFEQSEAERKRSENALLRFLPDQERLDLASTRSVWSHKKAYYIDQAWAGALQYKPKR